MSEHLMERSTEEQLMLFAEDSPVSRSVSPGSEQARMMTVTSGLRCLESFGRFSRVTSLARMLLGSSTWNSTIAYLTWKQSVTPAGRLLFRLVPSMPSTEGTEFGSSPRIWSTPAASQGGAVNPEREAEGWEWSGQYWRKPDGRKHQTSLVDQVKMYPTPQAHLSKEGGYPAEYRRNTLSLTAEAQIADGLPPASGSLNPEWVEWLMGFPEGWTDLNPSETP